MNYVIFLFLWFLKKKKKQLGKFVENVFCAQGKSELETQMRKIDFIVYHLYGLTYDEVLIVDPDTPITREEYEAYKGE